MAKKSMIAREVKRQKLVDKYAAKRASRLHVVGRVRAVPCVVAIAAGDARC